MDENQFACKNTLTQPTLDAVNYSFSGPQNGMMALMMASFLGHLETVQALLAARVALDIQSEVVHFKFNVCHIVCQEYIECGEAVYK